MSGCTLRFSQNSPLRTTLVDEATGQVKYKIETPIKIARSVTRIWKFKPQAQDEFNEEGGNGVETELPETGDEIARIYWKWLSLNRLVFGGRMTTRSVFLPKCGKLMGSFAFTGPDGVQYRWALGTMGMNLPKLVTTDERKAVIAEFRPPQYRPSKQTAQLKVQPEGIEMLDYIVFYLRLCRTDA